MTFIFLDFMQMCSGRVQERVLSELHVKQVTDNF